MPICEPCRRAASDTPEQAGELFCSWCGRGEVSVYRTDVPLAEQKVFFHKIRPRASVTKVRCPGTGKPPVVRSEHDRCKGCPCQHKPKGAWNASR